MAINKDDCARPQNLDALQSRHMTNGDVRPYQLTGRCFFIKPRFALRAVATVMQTEFARVYLTWYYVTLEAKAASRFSLLRSDLPFLFFLTGCPPPVLLAVEGNGELVQLTAALLGI